MKNIYVKENYDLFGVLLKDSIPNDSTITGSEIKDFDNGTYTKKSVFIYYTVSDEYQKEHELFSKNRFLEIILSTTGNFQGIPVNSGARD